MRKLAAVIFDMDGLMLNTQKLALQALRQAGAKLDLIFSEALLERLIGLNERDCLKQIETDLGQPIPRAKLKQAFSSEYEQALTFRGIELKAGLKDLLTFLESRHIRKAVATSTNTKLAIQKLTMVGLIRRFEAVIGGDQVAAGKPAPDAYQLALQELDLEATQAIALEDSEIGAKAAHAAGLPVVIVPDIVWPSAEIEAVAERVCESLHDVRLYLEALMRQSTSLP